VFQSGDDSIFAALLNRIHSKIIANERLQRITHYDCFVLQANQKVCFVLQANHKVSTLFLEEYFTSEFEIKC